MVIGIGIGIGGLFLGDFGEGLQIVGADCDLCGWWGGWGGDREFLRVFWIIFVILRCLFLLLVTLPYL